MSITLLALVVVAVGCGPGADTAQPTVGGQLDKVQTDTKSGAEGMKDYAFTQKADFVSMMETKVADLNRELDQLLARLERSSESAKAEAKPRLQAVRDRAAKLNQQLVVARNASESTWDSVTVGFQQGYQEMKDGVQSARHWASDKLAP